MENRGDLTPENDMQELWEMSGRVKALIDLAQTGTYIYNNEIVAMLGGEWTEPEEEAADDAEEQKEAVSDLPGLRRLP